MGMAILTVSSRGRSDHPLLGTIKGSNGDGKHVNWAMADYFGSDRSGVRHLDEMMECERGFVYFTSPHQSCGREELEVFEQWHFFHGETGEMVELSRLRPNNELNFHNNIQSLASIGRWHTSI